MGNKTQRQKIKEKAIFRELKTIDDPYYLRILDYKKEHLFEAIIFELLLRVDGFKKIYYKLFEYVKHLKKNGIDTNFLVKSPDEIKFEGVNAELDESFYIMLLDLKKTTPLIKTLKYKYGYEYRSLIQYISYILDKYYVDKTEESKFNPYTQIGFFKENLLETTLQYNHDIYDLVENANIKEEFFDYLLHFDIDKYKYYCGVVENIKYKKKTVNFEIKLHKNNNEQDRELERIKEHLKLLKKELKASNKDDLSTSVEEFINNPKESNYNLLNYFYCYDMMQTELQPNVIKKLTYEYVKRKNSDIKDNTLKKFSFIYSSIKPEAITKYSEKIETFLKMIK